MAKQNKAVKAQSDEKSRSRVKPTVVEELSDDLASLAKLPGGPIAAVGVDTIQAQAALLGEGRLQGAQRRALAAQIGRVQGNRHLQRVVALQQWDGTKTRGRTFVNTSTIQLALPQITEPSPPDISSLNLEEYPEIITSVEAFRDEGTEANGQAAVDAIIGNPQLDPGYRTHSDITEDSPLFLGAASGRAAELYRRTYGREWDVTRVAGFTYPSVDGRNKVEIYPRAFIGDDARASLGFLLGIIVHEYIHILQNRLESGQSSGGPTNAEREFQAWLWQAEHVAELGLPRGGTGRSQISDELTESFNGMGRVSKVRLRGRYRAALQTLRTAEAPSLIAERWPGVRDEIQSAAQEVSGNRSGSLRHLETAGRGIRMIIRHHQESGPLPQDQEGERRPQDQEGERRPQDIRYGVDQVLRYVDDAIFGLQVQIDGSEGRGVLESRADRLIRLADPGFILGDPSQHQSCPSFPPTFESPTPSSSGSSLTFSSLAHIHLLICLARNYLRLYFQEHQDQDQEQRWAIESAKTGYMAAHWHATEFHHHPPDDCPRRIRAQTRARIFNLMRQLEQMEYGIRALSEGQGPSQAIESAQSAAEGVQGML